MDWEPLDLDEYEYFGTLLFMSQYGSIDAGRFKAAWYRCDEVDEMILSEAPADVVNRLTRLKEQKISYITDKDTGAFGNEFVSRSKLEGSVGASPAKMCQTCCDKCAVANRNWTGDFCSYKCMFEHCRAMYSKFLNRQEGLLASVTSDQLQ